MPNALIGSGPLRNQPGRFRDILHEAGFETLDPPGSGALSESELREYLPRCSAIVAGGEPLSAEVLALCPDLRAIARTGVGYDAVNLESANEKAIAVTITPGTNHDSVAEQSFALLLAVLRRVAINDQIIRSGGWDRTLVAPARGKVLGLVGLGRIGRAMIPRALAFGMEVLGFDPVDQTSNSVRRVSLDELLAQSDIVSLHLPLTPSTRGLFNRALFQKMKPGSYLINTARGGVLNEPDLADALTSGHIAGAGLDVLEQEPPTLPHPLISLPNVVISPHIAGIDTQAMDDMATMAAQTIVDLKNGLWPSERIVNPEIQPRWKW